MPLPIGVLFIFFSLAVWLGLGAYGYRNRNYMPAILFGIGLMLYLNLRYVIEGPTAGIAFFIGIYDVLINLGLNNPEAAAAVATCPDNDCTVWGDRFVQHPAWGAAFYDRFANGPELRSNLLMGHIICNSIVFVLMHVQLFYPGGAARMHAALGRVTFAVLTIGVGCAVWLASEHGPVGEYGGAASAWGFYSMSAFVYGTAIMGIVAIRSGDPAAHRVWMWRFLGSMWGSFWLFRVLLFVIDPLFRNFEAVAIQTCIWGSAPAGILIAEIIRRRLDAQQDTPNTVAAE